MTEEEFRAQAELDLLWREAEIRLLGNQRAALADPTDPDGPAHPDHPGHPAYLTGLNSLRRVQVVMLYAHFEGFCKNTFVTYLQAINERRHRRGDVKHVLAAASLSAEFENLRSDGKIDLFKDLLPDDVELHTLGRQTAFVSQLKGFDDAVLKVPLETLDTKSNLEPILLKRLLYRCGCDPEMLSAARGALAQLVKRRHAVAHGERTTELSDLQYEGMESAALAAMRSIMLELAKLLREEGYRRR